MNKYDFFVKPNTKKKLIEFFIPEVVLAADTESAPGVMTGQGATGILFSDISKTSYMRQGAAADVAVAEVTMTCGTWVSGGFIEIDGTNMPGWYQFGIPDAALVQGVSDVMIGLEIPDTKGASVQIHIHLVRSMAWGGK